MVQRAAHGNIPRGGISNVRKGGGNYCEHQQQHGCH